MSAKERLLIYLAYLNIGQNKFAKNCGFSAGYINNVKDSIGSNMIQKISLTYPELNTNWLITGEGKMLKNQTEQIEYVETINTEIMKETTTINQRIAMIVERSNCKSTRQFSMKIGVAQTSFSALLHDTEPKFSTLQKILQAEPDVNAEWLMRGVGDMVKGNKQNNTFEANTGMSIGIQGDKNKITNHENVGELLKILQERFEYIVEKEKGTKVRDEQISQLISEMSKQREQIDKLTDKLIEKI